MIFNPWWGPSYLGLFNFLTHGWVRPLWDLLIFDPWWVRPLRDLLIFDPWWVRPLWDFMLFNPCVVRPIWDFMIFNPWWGLSYLGLINIWPMVGSVLFGTMIFNPWWGSSSLGLNFLFDPWWGPSSLGLYDSSRLVVKFAQQSPECSFIKSDLVGENTCPYLG